jgi:hypothetical protein
MDPKKHVFPACKRQIIDANLGTNRVHYRKFTSKRKIHWNIKLSLIQTAEILLVNKNSENYGLNIARILPANRIQATNRLPSGKLDAGLPFSPRKIICLEHETDQSKRYSPSVEFAFCSPHALR